MAWLKFSFRMRYRQQQSKTSAPARGEFWICDFASFAASFALWIWRCGRLSVMRMVVPSGMPQAKLMEPSFWRRSGARILYSVPVESPASYWMR